MATISTVGISLFSHLDTEERLALERRLSDKAVAVERGRTLAARGDSLTSLLILFEGRAHAEIVTGNGHVMVVENFIGPDMIASAMLFSPDPRFPVSVIADSTCRVTHLERGRLLDLCQQNRGILENVLSDMGRRVTFLAGRLRMSQFASLRQKIAVYLTEHRPRVDRNGTVYVVIPHSRQELADLFGVARPSLSRELSRLCDEGILCAHGNRVEIRDHDVLTALVSGCE